MSTRIELSECFHDIAIRVVLFVTGFILVRIVETGKRGYFRAIEEDRDIVETV